MSYGLVGKREPANIRPIDVWTVGHVGAGMIYGALNVPWWGALLLGIAWEIVEIPLKVHWKQVFPVPRQDSVINATFDVAGVMVGWGLVQLFKQAK